MDSPTPRRTMFTTVVGAAAILLGGAGSLFSLFALLLAIGKPYAASSAEFLGIFLIFILPPGTLLAGIGLLLRHRWARWWMILLMAALIALGVKGLVAPDQANPAYAPLPGPAADAVKHAVFVQSVACIGVGALVLLGLLSRPVRREFHGLQPVSPGFVPGAPPPPLPLESPHHESPGRHADHRVSDLTVAAESKGTILPMLAALLAIAAASLWFAWHGLETGETRLPLKHSHSRRTVTRAEDPALFWTSITLTTGLGGGCLVFAAWLVRNRPRSP